MRVQDKTSLKRPLAMNVRHHASRKQRQQQRRSCHTPCHAMSYHVMLCHAMPCRAIPCNAMLWHAMLTICYAMSCYAMLRHSRFLQPLRLKQCLTEFSEFNEQACPNTVYLLWICHSSLLGVANLFRSRLSLPVRRRLLRSLVPAQNCPSTQT